MDISELTKHIYTKQQAYQLVDALEELKAHLFTSKPARLDNYLTPDQTIAFSKICEREGVSLENPQTLGGLVEKIIKAVKAVPELSLTLAYSPTAKQVEDLAEWFLGNLDKQFLLNIQKDPQIIAGVVVGSGGKITDLSFKNKL